MQKELHKLYNSLTFLLRVRQRAMTRAYLSKQSFASAWRTVHEDVPVQASVLPRIPCCYGNVTHTLLQWRLTETDISDYLTWRCKMFMHRQPFLHHLRWAQLPPGHLEVCSSDAWRSLQFQVDTNSKISWCFFSVENISIVQTAQLPWWDV